MVPKEGGSVVKSSALAAQSTMSPTTDTTEEPRSLSYDDILGYFRGKSLPLLPIEMLTHSLIVWDFLIINREN